MERSPSKINSSLALLCTVVAFYGIGFGTMMIPTGLFVGLHVLVAAAIHIAFGAAFLVAAAGIRVDSQRAVWLAATTSATIVGLSVTGVAQSLAVQDQESVVFWAFISLFFACLTFAACREAFRIRKAKMGQVLP